MSTGDDFLDTFILNHISKRIICSSAYNFYLNNIIYHSCIPQLHISKFSFVQSSLYSFFSFFNRTKIWFLYIKSSFHIDC